MTSNLSLFIDLFGLCILFFICILSNRPSQILLSDPPKNGSGGGRSESVDFIRGLAITGIVFIHVNSYYQYFGPDRNASVLTLFLSNLSRFGVPAFILSSGIFLKPANFRDYWKPKILSLLVPYFLVSLLAASIKLGTFPDIREYLYGILLGTWCAPYYFVPLLISFYLIFPAMNAIRAKYNSKKAALSLLFASLLLNFAANHAFRFSENPWLKTIEPILFGGFLFFFTFGLLAGKWFKAPGEFLNFSQEPGSPLPYSLRKLLWVGISIYLTVVFLAGIFWKFDSSNHLLFYPLAMFLFLFFWAENVQKRKGHKTLISVFSFVGKNSMGIFLLHPILIHLMHAWSPFAWGEGFSWVAIAITGFANVALPLGTWLLVTKSLDRVVSFGISRKVDGTSAN
ncbi:acyltransferase family protein [Leptospira sanjuanensis]|uniref:acyltransferase family protein n=1 Tax=Leptospira sanjuanensis TaxID=2879643 RepID=UPI001EE82278|nr:acyltransferase [Leptospira sanjuanensis]MCG6169834.1 acyltransferase [Leptospira sanjuanensis]